MANGAETLELEADGPTQVHFIADKFSAVLFRCVQCGTETRVEIARQALPLEYECRCLRWKA